MGINLGLSDVVGRELSIGVGRFIQARALTRLARSFDSFDEFKKVMGPAGQGHAWHHIVEQNAKNVAKFGSRSIHNTKNLIKLPAGAGSIHAKISGHYSSIQDFTGGVTVRNWLSTQSFEAQYQYGVRILQQYGVIVP